MTQRDPREDDGGGVVTKRRRGKWSQMQRAMRYSIWDGMAANMSENLFGPFLSLFALELGATKAQIGLLSSLPSLLGNIAQIPAAMLTERLGRRKILTVWSAIGARLCLLATVFIPFLFGSEFNLIGLFIFLVAMRGFVNSLGVPAWTSIMADISPVESRGAFFSTRNILSGMTGFAGTLLAGWIIRTYGFPGGYQRSFFLAFLTGVLAIYFFARIPVQEPGPKKARIAEEAAETEEPAEPKLTLRQKWNRALDAFSQHANFRKYCFTSIFWQFSVSLGGPMVAVHFAENLGGTPAQWSIASSAGLVAGILFQKYWGRLADRFGPKNVMKFAGIPAAALPWIWLAIPIPQLGFIASFIGQFGWSGYNLAAFNLILELTPDASRSTYVGVYNTMAGISAAISPVIGGVLAEHIGMYWVLFLSGLLRFVAFLVFVFNVDDTRSTPMRWSDMFPDALRPRQKLAG
ncbi:MAG: MFS transporter [Firmicutes bacterium]|nr:MFS transporter [Bacillota bacterium]